MMALTMDMSSWKERRMRRKEITNWETTSSLEGYLQFIIRNEAIIYHTL
jgi:hypothetical protein